MARLINLLAISLFFFGHEVFGAQSQQFSQSDSSKLQFLLQGSQSQVSFSNNNYAEYGIRPTVAFFPFRQVSFHGHYFAVIKPDGSSNLNGLGFGAKYFLSGLGTSFSFKGPFTTVSSIPTFAYYVGMEFLTRDLRSNSVNLNYTGFAYMAGIDWHFHHKWFANFEFSYAKLKNALGSTNAQDLTLTTLGFALGVMI